ncbi:hypothetical protein AAMO2058_001172900 [Amorphochlora amoebiformis]
MTHSRKARNMGSGESSQPTASSERHPELKLKKDKKCSPLAFRSMSLRWAVRVDQWEPSIDQWNQALSILDREERERISRFHFFDDAKRSLLGRLLIRRLLHHQLNIPQKDISLKRTKKGKPFLANRTACPDERLRNTDFNVTHHGNWVALSAESMFTVGCDVITIQTPGTGTGLSVEPNRVCFQLGPDSDADRKCYISTSNPVFKPERKLLRDFLKRGNNIAALSGGGGGERQKGESKVELFRSYTDATMKVDGVSIVLGGAVKGIASSKPAFRFSSGAFDEHTLWTVCLGIDSSRISPKIPGEQVLSAFEASLQSRFRELNALEVVRESILASKNTSSSPLDLKNNST